MESFGWQFCNLISPTLNHAWKAEGHRPLLLDLKSYSYITVCKSSLNKLDKQFKFTRGLVVVGQLLMVGACIVL